MDLNELVNALSEHLPEVVRWSGAVAKRLRQYNISLSGKSSGMRSTDALTLADLCVQELIVAALRDRHPLFRRCRIEAEESTGDLGRFAQESPYTIAIDPIDGTRQYRDRTGNGYAVMLLARSVETVHYSLVFIPEQGMHGTWVEAQGNRVVCGEDDPTQPAARVLKSLAPIDPRTRPASKKIYLIGFQSRERAMADAVTRAGLEGVVSEDMPGSIFELLARGKFGGSLIHTPNVYDYPASLQIARILGGESLWVHNRQPVHFRETWTDDRADMVRLPGIIATSTEHDTLETLCALARDWNPNRYAD